MQENHQIHITEYDLKRLLELVQVGLGFQGKNSHHLERLQEELDSARVVDTNAVPHDVVTMNSQVRIREPESGEERVLTLVFPSDADVERNRISVLAPLGTALLGARAGEVIEWQVPAGRRSVKIEEVLYQPEAAGDYHL